MTASAAPTPPVGTVTFLFTDIQGSTRLARALGERWPTVMGEHQRLLREVFAEFRGYEVDTQGDSFFVAFGRARDAVEAAARGQTAHHSHEWPEGGRIAVRMGIHTGEAQLVDGHYRGVAVHRAARICAAAHGGQVLLSESTQRLLEDEPLPGVQVRELGRFKLKDIDRPEHLLQATAVGLPDRFPPPRTEEPAKPLWRRRLPLAAVSVAVAAGAVVAVLLATSSNSPGGLAHIDRNSVGRIDPQTGRILSEVSVGADPTRLAVDTDGSLWVANYHDETLSRVDPKTGKPAGDVRDGALIEALGAGGGAAWVVSQRDGSLLKIDPRLGGVSGTVPICKGGCSVGGGSSQGAVAVGGGAVWVTDGLTTLNRVDSATTSIVGSRDIGLGATAVTIGLGFVWVGGAGGITQVNPPGLAKVQSWQTGSVSRIAVGEGGVWAATGSTIVRIDPTQGLPAATIPIGQTLEGLAVGDGSVWAVSSSAATLYRIDPRTNQIVAKIRTGGVPTDVAVTDGAVWVSVG